MRRAAVLAAMACSAAAAAAPASPPPMTFQLARALDCDSDCPEWIAAQGEIKPGAAVQFKAFLDRLDGRRRPVIVNSNGGSIEDALEMGRMIRARRLAVAVGRTMFAPRPGDAGAAAPGPRTSLAAYAASYPALCASACSLILAGGIERYASPLAMVGVHQTKQNLTQTFVTRHYLIRYRVVNGRREEISREEVSEDKKTVHSIRIAPPEVNARLVAYFKQMGEDPKIVEIMQTATPDKIHLMTVDEEKDSRLVTIWIDKQAAIASEPPQSGLVGAPVDEASGAAALLEAEGHWTLEPSDEGSQRGFTAHFALRRGGGGVSAQFTLLDVSHAPLRYGLTPDRTGLWRSFANNAHRMTVFLPNEAFCRAARAGDVFVVRADRAPTFVAGLPDPSEPLLRAPLSRLDGLAALADEVCGAKAAAS